MARPRLSIAQVTPHPWGPRNEVNEFVERVSADLAKRGHRVLIAAPSDRRGEIRSSRAAINRAVRGQEDLFAGENPRVLHVGQSIPLPKSANAAKVSVPLDVNRTLDRLLGGVPLDVVHVHEPFAPSASSTGLRHSRSLNVGTFHEPAERVLSTQVARPLVDIFLGRLDARTASYVSTQQLLERSFPGSYELVRPGADRLGRGRRRRGVPHILFSVPAEERGALRLFMRAMRKLPLDVPWRATIWSDAPRDGLIRLSRRLTERVRLASALEVEESDALREADIVCFASGGVHAAPGLVQRAVAAGAVPVASDLPVYAELTGDGQRGLVFPIGSAEVLAGQLERLVRDPDRIDELTGSDGGGIADRRWSDVGGEFEEIFERLVERRHDPRGKPAVRKRLESRPVIECDLHMHTDHSWDCATPVRVLLETARDRGLGAIAITDHNEVSGALEAAEIAEEVGIKVIVAEEIKTADEGEVIGLFLEKLVPKGLTMRATIDEIRRQGGLVYVPHPFDRLHTVPDYEHLLKIVEEVDVLEVFNPRVAFSAFNEEAVRFAEKYRIVAGAGSDSHVAQGLGSVRIRLHDFDGPEEFLEAMRDADIVRKHRNLVYVQTLKFLQTTAGRAAGRRALAPGEARPARGGRPRRRPRRGPVRGKK